MNYTRMNGDISATSVEKTGYIRPTISLKSCVTFAGGEGSQSIPYEINYETC